MANKATHESEHVRTGAVIVAAGRGVRMGGTDKCALLVDGRSLLSYSIAAFAEVVDTIVVVVAPDRLAAWTLTANTEAWPRTGSIVAGGATRQDSVRAGVDELRRLHEINVIAVHDGARPLVAVETIQRCIARAMADGAAIAAVPVTDTIKRARDGQIVETLDRSTLWAAQTPQAFRADILQAAFVWASSTPHATFTDEASLIEAFGHSVRIIQGERSNIKVTEPTDLTYVATFLAARNEVVDA